jgi:OmpR-family two-component system manganese-sensing sensor histidine kinase
MFRATRRRLALWYVSLTAVLLLFFAIGIYNYVWYTLIDRVDDTLKHVVEVVERSLVVVEQEANLHVDVEASFRRRSNVREDDHIDLEWFSPEGALLWSTFSEPPAIALAPSSHGQTIHRVADQPIRQVTEPIKQGTQLLGYLRVSHPWFEVTTPIRQFVLDLSLGIGAMILAVGSIGWFLSGLAIRPVKESYQRLKQFMADVSHELRNPIAMIQTNAQAALNYSDPTEQHQQLAVIERLTQRLGKLVNDLLFLARLNAANPARSGELQPLPLDALLVAVVEEQQLIAAQHQVTLDLQIEGEQTTEPDFSVLGDWDQLARLMTNLLSNAIEYTRLREATEARSVKVHLQRQGSQFAIQVQDTGIGISAAALPDVFTRFYRAPVSTDRDPAQTSLGTGLGLAIAKAIVEQHHGQIQVTSVEGEGTTLTVQLPTTATS